MDRGARDEALLARIAAGEEDAVGELYDRYAARLYALALHICREGGAAEEIVQDVFVAVWREAARYDPRRGSVAAWLFGLTRNRAIDWLRRQARRPCEPWDRVEERPAADPEAAALAEDRVLAAQVRRALDELPEMYRLPQYLAYFRGLTQRQIADLMGLPLGTVKTRTRTALEYLRKAVQTRANRHGGITP